MSKLGTALAFLAGVAVGGVAAFTVLQKRYDDAVEMICSPSWKLSTSVS